MGTKIRIAEGVLRNIIKKAVHEALSNPGQIKFGLDAITEWTVKNDRALNEEASPNNNWILRKRNWEMNNYERFIDIVKKTPSRLKGFLTYHPIEDLQDNDWITYTLKGHDVAFALHYLEPGKVDICNLVNNSELKGIGEKVLTFAKMEGGTQMDNYRDSDGGPGKLGSLYRKAGFDKQTWHDKFNPAYQPDDPEWKLNTDEFGEPDVEGLTRSDHNRRYNNPQSNYRKKFDRRVGNKFGK